MTPRPSAGALSRGEFGGRLTTVKTGRSERRRRLVIAAMVAAVLLIVAAAGYGGYRLFRHYHVDQDNLTAVQQVDTTINGQPATIITRASLDDGPHPLALVTHGYQADQRVLRAPNMSAFTQDLVDAGWVVATSNAHGDAWGSPESQTDYRALYDHVARDYNISSTVIVSLSMGAVPALNMIAEDTIPDVAAWVGVSPITDLTALSQTEDWKKPISDALTPAQIASLDPMGLDLPDLPMIIYTSPTDKIAVSEVHATPFAEQSGADVRQCEGGHVAADCFRSADVIALAH